MVEGVQQQLQASKSLQQPETNFASALEEAMVKGSDSEIKEACDELASYMVSMVFKQVKQSMLQEDESSLLPKGDYIEMFEETMIDTVADEVVASGQIGISDMLYKQMKQAYSNQIASE